MLYYLNRAGFEGRIVSFPSWLDAQIGWVDTDADLAHERRTTLKQDAVKQLERIESVIAEGNQVWILVDSMAPSGTEPRATINDELFVAITEAGYGMEVADSELLILHLRKSSQPQPGDDG